MLFVDAFVADASVAFMVGFNCRCTNSIEMPFEL